MFTNQYEKNIIESILLTSPIKIDAVKDIEDLGIYPFTKENFNKVCVLLETGKYSKLLEMQRLKEKPFEDITVILFKDGKGDIYYTIIYDSWALEQFPEVMRIYSYVSTSI